MLLSASRRSPRWRCIPVRSELAEDEVMAALVARGRRALDPAELCALLQRAAAVFRDPALRRARRRPAAHRERQGAEVQAARARRHADRVGPRGRDGTCQARRLRLDCFRTKPFRPHEDRLHRRRPRGPLLRPADEAAGSAPRDRGGRAQQAVRHLRLGRRLLRPDARQPAGGRPEERGADPRRLQPLGRHRGQHPRPQDHVGRPRLLRHRQEAPAQHPAGALRGSRRRARVRDATCRAPTPTPVPIS